MAIEDKILRHLLHFLALLDKLMDILNKRNITGYLVLVVFLFTGCTNILEGDNDILFNNPNVRFNQLTDEEGIRNGQLIVQLSESRWLNPEDEYWINPDQSELPINHPAWMNYISIENQNQSFYLVLESHTINSQDFTILLLLNYEPVSFKIEGESEFATSLQFTLEGSYEVKIPILLDPENLNSDSMNVVTLFAIRDFEFEKTASWFEDIAVSYTLSVGTPQPISFSRNHNTTPTQRINVPHQEGFFVDLQVNRAFDIDLNNTNFFEPPESIIQVNPNEVIDFAFFVDPMIQSAHYFFESDAMVVGVDNVLDEYLIIAFMNWEPVVFNETEPYLFVNARNHMFERIVDQGTFNIQAPEAPGIYSFIAFLSPNPRRVGSRFQFPLDSSWRFFIEVVEE